MLKFQDNYTTTIATFEDFILIIYVIIDDFKLDEIGTPDLNILLLL